MRRRRIKRSLGQKRENKQTINHTHTHKRHNKKPNHRNHPELAFAAVCAETISNICSWLCVGVKWVWWKMRRDVTTWNQHLELVLSWNEASSLHSWGREARAAKGSSNIIFGCHFQSETCMWKREEGYEQMEMMLGNKEHRLFVSYCSAFFHLNITGLLKEM